MLGELTARKWLMELPAKLQEPTSIESDSQPRVVHVEAWQEQARFGRKAWAVSLSVVAPVVLGNFEIPKAKELGPDDSVTSEDSIAYWQSLIQAVKARGSESAVKAEVSNATVDPLAVCDRYLTILFSVSSDQNNVGTLFQPDDLKPRVTQANFVSAAQIMQDLYAASGHSPALLVSHADAWQVLTGAAPAVTIGLPPVPSAEVDKVNAISVSPPPGNPARKGTRVKTGWNSGRGLVVSLSKQCRQSGSSIDFARWLASDATRQVFERRIVGMISKAAYAPGSSAWQAQQVIERLGGQSRLPAEPRLPKALEYRRALGEQIAAAMRGEKSIEAALSETDKAWQTITASGDPKEQAASYLPSLGLN